MAVATKLFGLLLVAILGGCSAGGGLPQIALLGPGGAGAPLQAEDYDEADLADGPPLPVRNASRVQAARSGAAQGEKKQPGFSLAKLTDVKLFTAAAPAPDTTQWKDKPVIVYTQIAQKIRTCWMTPGAPKLPNHRFHAEVAAGNADDAKIILYQEAANGRRGLQAFRILINETTAGSVVKAENRRLDKKLNEDFKKDLSRWAQGSQNCQG